MSLRGDLGLGYQSIYIYIHIYIQLVLRYGSKLWTWILMCNLSFPHLGTGVNQCPDISITLRTKLMLLSISKLQ